MKYINCSLLLLSCFFFQWNISKASEEHNGDIITNIQTNTSDPTNQIQINNSDDNTCPFNTEFTTGLIRNEMFTTAFLEDTNVELKKYLPTAFVYPNNTFRNKLCYVFKKLTQGKKKVSFDKIKHIINVIFAQDEQQKTRILKDIDENITLTFDDKQPSRAFFKESKININKQQLKKFRMSFHNTYMHEFGHLFQYTYLHNKANLHMLKYSNKEQYSIIFESVSILFELLSCIIANDPFTFFNMISLRIGMNLTALRDDITYINKEFNENTISVPLSFL